MKNLSLGLLVALTTTVLSGCALYFGDEHDHGDSWTYCGSDGYYTCDGDNCQWVSATCPDQGSGSGMTGGGSGSGFECTDNSDCAAGCYCANGVCEEAGFCTQDSDCGDGYTCNEDRSSCEPVPPNTCDYDNECQEGQYCAPDHTCVATCICTDDETAQANGFGWCDETRSTCLPGEDPSGTCGGEADPMTCNLGRPACPAGTVAELFYGCWTGECRAIAECDVDPVCEHITDKASCDARTDCSEVTNGVNCTKPNPDPNGPPLACQDGDMGCTCESYPFASCATN